MSAHRKLSIVRAVVDTAAMLAVLGAAAAPAYAINQDQGGGNGVVVPGNTWPEQPPADGGVDASSAALGALGGIALGGAGLVISIGVQRRRDHTEPRPA